MNGERSRQTHFASTLAGSADIGAGTRVGALSSKVVSGFESETAPGAGTFRETTGTWVNTQRRVEWVRATHERVQGRAGVTDLRGRRFASIVAMDTSKIERETAHRPWPLPDEPWLMFQSWQQLLFMHWRVPLELLRRQVPAPLLVEEHDGSAWIGLTPFRLVDLRPRYTPPIPGMSTFPEMNLRTYVRHEDRPGVFFFTLEAGNALAVIGARILYGLPYHRAQMSIRYDGDWIHYHSRRARDGVVFQGRYRPSGPAFTPVPGTLEFFLTERYALFTVVSGRRVRRGDIHHPPWELRPAEAVIEVNTVPQAYGFDVGGQRPVVHYAERQDTLVWLPRS